MTKMTSLKTKPFQGPPHLVKMRAKPGHLWSLLNFPSSLPRLQRPNRLKPWKIVLWSTTWMIGMQTRPVWRNVPINCSRPLIKLIQLCYAFSKKLEIHFILWSILDRHGRHRLLIIFPVLRLWRHKHSILLVSPTLFESKNTGYRLINEIH